MQEEQIVSVTESAAAASAPEGVQAEHLLIFWIPFSDSAVKLMLHNSNAGNPAGQQGQKNYCRCHGAGKPKYIT